MGVLVKSKSPTFGVYVSAPDFGELPFVASGGRTCVERRFWVHPRSVHNKVCKTGPWSESQSCDATTGKCLNHLRSGELERCVAATYVQCGKPQML